jgi:uncharacterized membrane protein YfcA
VSVGASSAGFGAIGILACCQFAQRFREGQPLASVWSRTWIPLGAATALLALMGTSPGSDLAGHGLGLAFGVLLAVPFCVRAVRRREEVAQRLIALVCLALVLVSWAAAFRYAEFATGASR